LENIQLSGYLLNIFKVSLLKKRQKT